MNWKSCLEEGLIKQDTRASTRVPASIEAAERFARSAERTLAIEEFEMAHLAAYNSAFHSARALLFSQGYTERSHACVVIAIRHLFTDDTRLRPFLATLDKMRISRHNVQYGATRVSREEAEYTSRFAVPDDNADLHHSVHDIHLATAREH
jgi:uncharacterized protein (UPF0332 family)